MPKPNNAPQVNILRPCYAMASTDGQTADITMYGEIVETQPMSTILTVRQMAKSR